MTIVFNASLANTPLQNQVDAIDAAGTQGQLLVYANARPDVSQPAGASSILNFFLENPAFGPVVGGVSILNGNFNLGVNTTATPTWFRVVDGQGATVYDGDCGIGEDLDFGVAELPEGAEITALDITLTEGTLVGSQFATSVPYAFVTDDSYSPSAALAGTAVLKAAYQAGDDPISYSSQVIGTNLVIEVPPPVEVPYDAGDDPISYSSQVIGTNLKIIVAAVDYVAVAPDEYNPSAALAGTNEIKVVSVTYSTAQDDYTPSAQLGGTNVIS